MDTKEETLVEPDRDAVLLLNNLNMILGQMRDTAWTEEEEVKGHEESQMYDEVFNQNPDSFVSDVQEYDVYRNLPNQPKSSSVGLNVYNDDNSRPNSVDYSCTPNIFKSSSVGTSDLIRLDNSFLTRTTVESTPLAPTNVDEVDSLDDLRHQVQDASLGMVGVVQERNNGSVRLRSRGKKIDYALYHKTGFK